MDIWQALLSSSIPNYTIRLGAAAVMGGIIGLDREARDRPAGLRTHMMTAMAASIFTILTLDLHETFATQNPQSNADPIRVIEAVTAGVAFLAAGAIIQARGHVKGLTTGAGMWLAGALGVACGMQNYTVAFTGLILAILILAVIRPLEWKFGRKAEDPSDTPDRFPKNSS
ncbi:MgtC/SapB family protein [Parvibaculum sp.]|uniref:MgtC/SapB family protein n=1 Tax=Parvibaculum sp. TaxID=2024848 RepID=UPI003919BC69